MTKNKIALVTGGSRGLGKDMAMRLAEKGIDVLLTYHRQENEAQEVVHNIRATGRKAVALQLDAGNVSILDDFYRRVAITLGDTFDATHFDFLINNAGTGLHASFTDTTETQFDEMMSIHFKGVFFISQKALPLLRDGGGIVNISTGLTRFSSPGRAAYASMKGGLETLSKYMAAELGQRRIRVNVVAPGAIETDFSGGIVRDNPEVNKHIADITALGRVGLPSDIGGVVAFLCTDDARWINAQRIEVSGGMNL